MYLFTLNKVVNELYQFNGIYKKDKRTISTGQLNRLLCVHTQPIKLVVFKRTSGRVHLGIGFPLRCFQRLSHPNLATQLCPWQDNWCTSGSFTPVLSY